MFSAPEAALAAWQRQTSFGKLGAAIGPLLTQLGKVNEADSTFIIVRTIRNGAGDETPGPDHGHGPGR